MSDATEPRPTPETDAVVSNDSGDSGYIFNLAKIARQLERQRDEARDAIRAFLASCNDDSDNYVGGVERLLLETQLTAEPGPSTPQAGRPMQPPATK